VYNQSLKTEIERSLTTLTERQKEVICFFFGIGVDHPMSLEDIGEKFSLTRERVRQIKDKSITMFNSLQERLDSAFKNIKGQARVTELNVAATLKDIRRALVDADVNYKIAKDFTDRVKEKAIGEKVINAMSSEQLMVKIVKDELQDLMGGEEAVFNAKGSPAVILIADLQGSGKTTFSGKLANYLKTKKGLSPMLVAADIYRPAAMEQLRVLGEQIGIDVHIELESKDPVAIAQNAIKEARSKNKNV